MKRSGPFSSIRDLALEIKWSLGLDEPTSKIEDAIDDNKHLFDSYREIDSDELLALKEAVYETFSGGDDFPFSRSAALLQLDSLKELAKHINNKHFDAFDTTNAQVLESLQRLSVNAKKKGLVTKLDHITPEQLKATVAAVKEDLDLEVESSDKSAALSRRILKAASDPRFSRKTFVDLLRKTAGVSGRKHSASSVDRDVRYR